MINLGVRKFAKYSAIVLLGISVAGTPVFAVKGGNGNGNSGNAGGGNSSAGNGTTNNGSVARTDKIKTNNGAMASKFGKLNGFLHASPVALTKASPKSSIGQVAKVYAGLLGGYLSPVAGQVAPTIEEVAAALAAAANKPLTADVIGTVNARLMATNLELATSLTASGKTAEDLAAEIAAAMAI